MLKWVYKSEKEMTTGYEVVIDKLKEFTKERYLPLSTEDRAKMVDEVFNIYRGVNVYPINYYNNYGIAKEINKCIDRDVEFKEGTLALKLNQGNSLCRFLFPNLNQVDAKVKNNSMYERFYNDHKLKRAIDFALRFKKSVTPVEIRTALEMIGGNVASNFKPMVAKALYERYAPKDGVIFDSSAGFGGRMLGALSSKNNYTYIGLEPCTDTFAHLNELGKAIEEVTKKKDSFKVMAMGSEVFNLKKEYFDFSFTSPPYFNLEVYSEEETQSCIKFPTLDEWLDGFVKPTVQNTYDMLKTDCYCAINIADFNIGSSRVEFVDKWIDISKEIGFEYIEKIDMKLTTRRGAGHKDESTGADKNKEEGIYVFKKVK
jgi:hypothetical protein